MFQLANPKMQFRAKLDNRFRMKFEIKKVIKVLLILLLVLFFLLYGLQINTINNGVYWYGIEIHEP